MDLHSSSHIPTLQVQGQAHLEGPLPVAPLLKVRHQAGLKVEAAEALVLAAPPKALGLLAAARPGRDIFANEISFALI